MSFIVYLLLSTMERTILARLTSSSVSPKRWLSRSSTSSEVRMGSFEGSGTEAWIRTLSLAHHSDMSTPWRMVSITASIFALFSWWRRMHIMSNTERQSPTIAFIISAFSRSSAEAALPSHVSPAPASSAFPFLLADPPTLPGALRIPGTTPPPPLSNRSAYAGGRRSKYRIWLTICPSNSSTSRCDHSVAASSSCCRWWLISS
mmetsp:Transcript_8402/g.23685  ORF Transcript_8402/g.23685 Transcript_8402/m.23685 type:complete len:204 (+) Transcript_8402:1173-1784(+)